MITIPKIIDFGDYDIIKKYITIVRNSLLWLDAYKKSIEHVNFADIKKYREIKNMNGYDDLEKFYINQIELLLQKQSNISCTVLIWNQTDVLTETINRKTTYDKKDKRLIRKWVLYDGSEANVVYRQIIQPTILHVNDKFIEDYNFHRCYNSTIYGIDWKFILAVVNSYVKNICL